MSDFDQERLAVLETEVKQLKVTDDKILAELVAMRAELNQFSQDLTSKKSLVLGAIFAISVIWGAAWGIYQMAKGLT